MITLVGVLESIIYCSEQSDFVVAKFQEQGKSRLVTIVGNLSGIHAGESLKLAGRWEQNKKFGEQFRVESYEFIVPATLPGIRKYLGSGLIKGIGPVMANRIVDAFGTETLDIIEKAPERLSEVEGIGSKRITMIARAFEEQKKMREVMIFLQGHGISAAYSSKIYKQYGDHAIEAVRENPYRLSQDIHGIGFTIADRIARSMGIAPDSLIRAKEGLLYVLSQLTEEGHVYYPETDLLRKAIEVLGVNEEKVTQAMMELSDERKIFLEKRGEGLNPKAVYLAPFFVAEKGCAERLKGLLETGPNLMPPDPQEAIRFAEEKLHLEFDPKQKESIEGAMHSKVLVITGGPGTGKTTLIKVILSLFNQWERRTLLAAPTGRAAKRMSEATGCEAKTIHRLLEYSPREGVFRRNEENPLEADAVIIDEASMVDILLMYHLLNAIPASAHLILVGDVDQLPSVGPGNVLKDIIESRVFPVVKLTEIFRQGRGSMIVVNAHRVNHGELPVLSSTDREGSRDFYFIEEEKPEEILTKILRLCAVEIPERFGVHPIRDIQVLTPMHRGTIGVSNLNLELQKRLNPTANGLSYGAMTFGPGDKVMQISNNYEKEVFNGDIGWISGIDSEAKKVAVDFDGRVVPYAYSELDEVILAYAISVHKSQGSEYPVVILPVTTQHYLLLQRNLIYTGMTRAKRLVVLIGTKKAMAIAIRNNRPRWRLSDLSERLKV